MCGRYTLTAEAQELHRRIVAVAADLLRDGFAVEDLARILKVPGRRRFNIVPTSREPIVRMRAGGAVVEAAHWWLLPPWAGNRVGWRRGKDGEKSFTWKAGDGPRTHFNSRKDTLTAPGGRYWNGLLESQRCLVPADGFVEWPDDALRPRDQEKIPRHFSLHARRPFFFAGVWDETTDDEGHPFLSFNIVTVPPNDLLRGLPHHRMPAILEDAEAARWLSPATRAAEAASLLQPFSGERMTAYPVSNLVNAAGNEGPEVLAPRGTEAKAPGEPSLWDGWDSAESS